MQAFSQLIHYVWHVIGDLPATNARINEATAEQVERYLERFVNASTLADIFLDRVEGSPPSR